MSNAYKIKLFLKKNKDKAFTSKVISKALKINPISTSRTLRKMQDKNRIKVTKKKTKKGRPKYFYHNENKHKIIRYIYNPKEILRGYI